MPFTPDSPIQASQSKKAVFTPDPPEQNPVMKFAGDIAHNVAEPFAKLAETSPLSTASRIAGSVAGGGGLKPPPITPDNPVNLPAYGPIVPPTSAKEYAGNLAKAGSFSLGAESGLAAPFGIWSGGQALTENKQPKDVASDAFKGALLGRGVEIAAPIISNAAVGTFKALKDVPENVYNVFNPDKFAGKVRNAMFANKQDIGEAIDPAIEKLAQENPGKTIDLRPHFNQIKNALNDPVNPGLASDISRTLKNVKDPETAKLINGLVENPEGAANLTLPQSESIKRAISQSPTIASKMRAGKFANWTPGDYEILDLLGNIKSTQADQFGDELSNIRKPYADFMQNYNQIKGKFKPGQLVENLKTKFGDPEVNTMAEKLLPEDTASQVRGFRRTGKTLNAGAKALGIGGAGELSWLGLSKILSKLKGQE